MSVPKHLDQSAAELRAASERIEAARQRPASLESVREWLDALTDYCSALSDIHSFNNESVHEKLHSLAERVGLRKLPGDRARSRPD
jgi:hypothetical protein